MLWKRYGTREDVQTTACGPVSRPGWQTHGLLDKNCLHRPVYNNLSSTRSLGSFREKFIEEVELKVIAVPRLALVWGRTRPQLLVLKDE